MSHFPLATLMVDSLSTLCLSCPPDSAASHFDHSDGSKRLSCSYHNLLAPHFKKVAHRDFRLLGSGPWTLKSCLFSMKMHLSRGRGRHFLLRDVAAVVCLDDPAASHQMSSVYFVLT